LVLVERLLTELHKSCPSLHAKKIEIQCNAIDQVHQDHDNMPIRFCEKKNLRRLGLEHMIFASAAACTLEDSVATGGPPHCVKLLG